MTTFSIHVGAHKTATTYLQSRLQQGSAHLRTQNILFEPMPKFRARFTRHLWRAFRKVPEAPTPQDLQAAFGFYLRQAEGHFVASDENLVGTCNLSGRVYADSKARFEFLKACLPGSPDVVVLTVREYAGWLASYYSESIRWQPFVSFDTYKRRLKLDDGLWVRVVEALVETFGAGTVKVMRYETLQDRLPALLSTLCGAPIDETKLPESDDRREGLSAAAIEAVGKIADLSDAHIASSAIDAAMKRFPRSPEFPAFAPWSAEEIHRLKALYADHMSDIGRRHPGIFI